MRALRLRIALGLALLAHPAASATAQFTSSIEFRAHASGPAELQDWRGASHVGATVRFDRPRWSLSSSAALSGGEDRWWGSGSVSGLVTSPAIGPLQFSATAGAIRDGRQGVVHNELMGQARASLRFASRGAWFGFERAQAIADEAVPRSPTPVIGAWQQFGSALLSVQLAPRRARAASSTMQYFTRPDSTFTDTLGWEYFGVPDSGFASVLQSWSDAEARVVWAHGRWAFDGMLGARLAPRGLDRSVWGQVHGLYALSSRLALVASTGNMPADPIRGWERQTFATLGVRLMGSPEPRPDLDPGVRPGAADFRIEPTRSGERLIRIRVPHARTVELSATFTGWQPVPLARESADWWQLTIAILPGTHHVNIRVDGDTWTAPPGTPAVEDEFNGTVGLLVIE